MACYEETMYRYLLGHQADAGLCAELHTLIARVNRHSLGILEEMLDFVCGENIYDAGPVNAQAAAWAGRINLFDLELQAQLAGWQARMEQHVACAQGGAYATRTALGQAG